MASLQDVETGAQALKDYVVQIDGWLMGNMVPWGTDEAGARIIVNKWDALSGNHPSDDLDVKYASCGLSLFTAITNAGYGDRVTRDQCTGAAEAVITAVMRMRGTPVW